MAMDPEKKAEWVEALRSGTYRQGTKRLRRRQEGDSEDRYCCLGVLCDISNDGHWEYASSEFLYYYKMGDKSYDNVILPTEISRKYNITSVQEYSLIDLNDNGASFPEIALYIEENL
jgi:hypothetical protein